MRTFDEIREEVFAKYPICKDAGKWLIPSAVVAKVRLINVIDGDRQAVPCGRWVRRIRPLVETQFLVGLAMTAIKYPYLRTAAYRRDCKPRWRLEYRR